MGPFCVLVTQAINVGQGHKLPCGTSDYVKMNSNSWCKFDESSTNRYCNIDLNISFLPWSLKREM